MIRTVRKGAHQGLDTLTALPAHVRQWALLASYLHPASVVLALKITTVTFENDIQKEKELKLPVKREKADSLGVQ